MRRLVDDGYVLDLNRITWIFETLTDADVIVATTKFASEGSLATGMQATAPKDSTTQCSSPSTIHLEAL